MTSERDAAQILIHLTEDEALVLEALLARSAPSDPQTSIGHTSTLSMEHPADQAALWALHAALEKVLVAPLRSDYAAALEAARDRVSRQAGLRSASGAG
jgi:hypothetical protein